MDGVGEEQVSQPAADWIRGLGPGEARWVLLFALHDAASKLTFGSTGNAEVSGALYDRQNGTVLWRDKAVGQVGQGGLVGMFMKGSMVQAAVEEAVKTVMKSFPKRGA